MVILVVLVGVVEKLLSDLCQRRVYLDILVVVDGRLQGRMSLHVRMPDAVDGDVVQLVAVVVLQVEIYQILYGSPPTAGTGNMPDVSIAILISVSD